MKDKTLQIELVRAEDDPPLRSSKYQEQVRAFEDSLHSYGLKPSTEIEGLHASAEATAAVFIGKFVVIAKAVGPFITGPIMAYLHGKSGRKVRIKTKEFTVEVQTTEDAERLVQLLQSGKKTIARTPKVRKDA